MNFKRKREQEAVASLRLNIEDSWEEPPSHSLSSSSPSFSSSRNKNRKPSSASKLTPEPPVPDHILSLSQLSNATHKTMQESTALLLSESYWNWVCTSNPFRARKKSRYVDSAMSIDVERSRHQLLFDGYTQIRSHNQILEGLIQTIIKGIHKLEQKGYPPTFMLLFDECWELIQMFSATMSDLTGNQYCNFDILAWVVDPRIGSGAGFSPHRDRQPNDVVNSFHPDGSPKYCTCWVALTDATPENSCLFMIPKWADPGYSIVESDALDADPMRAALQDKHDYQNIRAIPLTTGNSVVFSHRILHWGSKASSTVEPSPRISMAFAFSDPTFEAPYLSPEHFPLPPFHLRAALAAAQMIIYYQRFPCTAKDLLLFKSCFDAHASSFDGEYRKKVNFEFASAVMEFERGSVTAPAVDERSKDKGDRIEKKESVRNADHPGQPKVTFVESLGNRASTVASHRRLTRQITDPSDGNIDEAEGINGSLGTATDDELPTKRKTKAKKGKKSSVTKKSAAAVEVSSNTESDSNEGFDFGEPEFDDDPVEHALEAIIDDDEAFQDDFDDYEASDGHESDSGIEEDEQDDDFVGANDSDDYDDSDD